MSILWFGGEDTDFLPAPPVTTTAGMFRAGYARCCLGSGTLGALERSSAFPGGAVTSCWFTCRCQIAGGSPARIVGLMRSSTVGGLWLTYASGDVRLLKHDGTTATTLATASGGLFTASVLHRFDVQLINYGASATVNVWIDSVLAITYSGDVTVSGVTDLDQVAMKHGDGTYFLSEMIVADEDVRAMSLVTQAPNADGTLQQWTGLVATVNKTTINDATMTTTNTVTQDQQFNLIDLPAGTFTVRAVKIAARANSTAGATATKIALGVKNGAGIDYGTLQSPGTSFVTLERYMAQDPTTSADWAQADMNGLQVNLRSGS